MAVGYRLSGRITPLPDPFGDVLGHTVSDSVLKTWSKGPRLRDNPIPIPQCRREFRVAPAARPGE
jgi:hypothetical protein